MFFGISIMKPNWVPFLHSPKSATAGGDKRVNGCGGREPYLSVWLGGPRPWRPKRRELLVSGALMPVVRKLWPGCHSLGHYAFPLTQWVGLPEEPCECLDDLAAGLLIGERG